MMRIMVEEMVGKVQVFRGETCGGLINIFLELSVWSNVVEGRLLANMGDGV